MPPKPGAVPSAPASTPAVPAAPAPVPSVPQQSVPKVTETSDATELDASAPAAPAPIGATAPITPEQFAAPTPPADGAQSGQSAPNAPNASEAGAGQGKGKAGKKSHKGLVAVLIVLVVLIVLAAAGLTAYLTYRNEVWGGKSLPAASSIQPSDGKVVSAKDITEALKNKGLKPETKTEFSGKPKGAFLGYDGHDEGTRVDPGSTITVRESLGPGVPQEVSGMKAEDAVALLKDMGVDVHYKQVTVNDTSKKPAGTVVASYPAAGQAVTDTDKGIYVGVATEGDGIGFDIIGQNKDDAASMLESKGYDVTFAPRLSSKDNVGKVVGTNPAPGESSGASDVTVYYGIDSSGVKDAYTVKDSPEIGGDGLLGSSALAAGTWCNNDGKCVTFNAKESTGSFSSPGSITYTKGTDGTDYGSYGSLISCDSLQQPYCSNKKADFQLTGDRGVFELFPRDSLANYWCGSTVMTSNGVGGPSCSDGTYHMQDFYLVVPTGADLKGLEDDGYFDADALATAGKEKAVDTTRPFLIVRDPSLYKETTASRGNGSSQNPFIPFDGYNGSKDGVAKMKPAPSDSSAYYLVEAGGDIDWDALKDAEVKGADAASAGKSDSSKSDSSKEDDQAKANAAMFKAIADQYRFASTGDGSVYVDMTVNDDGSFSGEVNEADPNSTEPVFKAPRITHPFHGKFKTIEKNSANGYDMQCDTSAFGWDGDEYQYADEAGVSPCGTWHWYPAGTPWSSMAGGDNAKTSLAWAGGGSVMNSDSWKANILYDEDAKRSAFVPYQQ